ncbi:MAG: class I tRNA ligase family protein [Clostridia bacterium]|nr:class I tRNA ligase family protein [Clostridia bacterium]
MNLSEDEPAAYIPENLALEDKWIFSVYSKLVKEVTDNLEKFELGMAVSKLYDFIWDVFCDWYIEIAKIRLQKDDESSKTAKAVLVYIFTGALKLLHPFMPFITEEIWQSLPHVGESIMVSEFPVYDEKLVFEDEEKEMDKIMTAIRAIRNRRAEMNVVPSKKAKVFIETEDKDTFEQAGIFMQKLASASEVEVGDNFDMPKAVSIITEDARMYIPLDELVDFEAEKARLNKELVAAEKDLEFINNKLNNPNFVSKAPEAVVQKQKEAAEKLNDKIAMLKESIASIGK